MTTIPAELLPCPFCGCAELNRSSNGVNNHFVTCDNCGCEGPPAKRVQQAIAEWNGRTLLSEQPQADHSAQDLNMVEQPQAGAGEHDPMRQLANTYKATAMMLSDEVRRLREALELIADTDPDDGTSWFHDVANAALTQSPKGEEE